MSEEKFSKCEEEKKCLSIEFRVFEKCCEWKVRKENFGWNLLSSCSLGKKKLLICKLKLQRERKWEFSKYFAVKYLKLEIWKKNGEKC